jgi:hypothetical protein
VGLTRYSLCVCVYGAESNELQELDMEKIWDACYMYETGLAREASIANNTSGYRVAMVGKTGMGVEGVCVEDAEKCGRGVCGRCREASDWGKPWKATGDTAARRFDRWGRVRRRRHRTEYGILLLYTVLWTRVMGTVPGGLVTRGVAR